jgi:hypothetical protein
MKIPDTTLVAVSSNLIDETLYALRYSLSKIRFTESLFLTSAPILSTADIRVQPIPPITSVDEYSNFIIYELHKFIKTSYCLIVQWDGFVINDRCWTNEFLEYDYIGAPFKKRLDDPVYATDNMGTFYAVGNGGFSLRSKSLLLASTKLGLVRPFWSSSNNEDGFFCVENRRTLESHGFKWAPEALATRFSNECGMLDKNYFRHSFGFHGKRLLQRHQLIKPWIAYGY